MRTIEKLKRGLFLVALFLFSLSMGAQKFWVGGEGNWSDVGHWSNTSGGSGGASLPTIADDVFFDINSGFSDGQFFSIDSLAFAKNINFSNLSSSIKFIGPESAGLLVTGIIEIGSKVKNEFKGYASMVGTASNYKYKKFEVGEFYGKQSFIDVYKDEKEGVTPLIVSSVDTTIVDATCGCNGSITITPNDGVGPFIYDWYPKTQTGDGTNTITDLCPGRYTCVIYDGVDPFIVSDIQVDGPSPLTISLVPPIDSVDCNGGSDGQLIVLVFGGVQPYTYTWNDPTAQANMTTTFLPPSSQRLTVPGLPAGSYSLSITDDVACNENGPTWTVEEPTLLTSSITDTTHVFCFSDCTGDATVTPAGGTPGGGYTFDWYDAPGTPTTAQATNLCQGTYHVEVTDGKGCLDTTEITIAQPTELQATISDFTDVQCFGNNDGTASAGVIGGTSPYTYDWYNKAPTATTPAVSNLGPGTYNVEVTDASGCLDTAEVSITEPILLTSSITDTIHILCNGDASGEAEVTAAGGTTGYNYLWYDATNQTTARVSSMSAGTYNVQVTDDNGCLDTSTVTLLQPATAVASSITDTTHNLCFGDCNGIAIVTPTGGTVGYSFDWYDAPGSITDSTINSLCAGTYNVRVTDGNGCTDESEVIITEPAVLTGSTVLTMVDCKSNCNGEIDLSPIGGTTTYSFDWYDVPGTPTTEDITGLCDGTYNVEITDANGCLDTVTSIITEPDTLIAGIVSSTNILCNGLFTGSASVSQTGGIGPFDISWYDYLPSTPTSATINNVPAGTYNVEITDANGCKDTTDITLTEPALPLTSSITDTVHVLCKDVCSGEAEVTAAGGIAGYNYDWYDVPGAPTVVRATNLCDGTYHVEITDVNGCLDTAEVIITEPVSGISVLISDSVNATCNGLCDAKAFVTYSGGTGSYTVDWYSESNEATDTIYNLCAGTSFVQVTDDNGCSDTDAVFIEEPAPMVITINSATLPTCFSDCNGVMSVTPSGGTSPYSYNWYDATGTPTTSTASGQCAGPYNVRVEDTQGCVDTTLVILSEPDSLEHTIDSEVDLLCKNLCNGSADMTPIGGTAPYTITWFDVPTSPTGTTVSDLCAGTWNFELEDANGCLDSGTVNLTEPALELTSSITDTTHNICFGECNGDATVTAAGGTGLLTYDWYNAPDGDTDVQAENLCAGTYDVEVTDANGCLDTSNVIITEPLDMVLVTTIEVSSCGNVDTSKASVAVSGGVAPYTYDWYDAGNETNDTVTGLSSGTFHCEVTDANGCIDTAEVIITTPSLLIASIRNDTIHNDCFQDCEGRAYVLFAGGTPGGYSQIWYDVPGAPTTRAASNLCGGVYHVELRDINGCLDTAEVEIREPTLLVSSADSVEASCAGVCDGRVWTDYSGGTPPYSLDWYNVPGTPTTDTVNAMCTGAFAVEITDANGCLDTAFVDVTAPIVVTSSITDTTHLLCFDDCNGQAIVTPLGGVLPYSYSWYSAPGLDTDSTGDNLCVGSHGVEITDANGCIDTSFVTITSTSPEFTSTTDSILTQCVGSADGSAIIVPSGGVSPYDIDWYNNGNQITDTISGLIAGAYDVKITDALGCLDTLTAIVTEPDTLRAIISDTTHILCFADSTGEAIVSPVGGTPGYTYDWYDVPGGGSDSTVSGLAAGTYHVEVMDANGCVDTGVVTIIQSTIVVLTSDSIPATCTGICTGAAIVNATGGVGPYVYDWYDAGNQMNDTASALCAGVYNVEVSDANGCLDTLEVEVTEPVTITVSAVDSMATTCNNGADGWAAISGAGGTLPYSYWWNDLTNQTNDTAVNLLAGTYKAAVTDVNGCSDTLEIIVNQPDSIAPNDSLVNVSCNSICDGFIRLDITGGTEGAGYTHSWNTASVDTFVTNLCAGTYTDTITDGVGCIDTLTFVISEPDSLKALFSDTTDVTCSYSANGQAIVTPTGGTPVYSYDWYDVPGGDSDSVASGIIPGTYHVEVTDINGCIDTGQIVIGSPLSLDLVSDSVESTCSGICDGIAIVNVAGGTAPYSYDWFENGNIDNDSIYNICADTFSVAVMDINGCRDTAYVIVTQPVTVTANIVDTTETTCYLGSDGFAVIDGSGGSAPYSYWWSAGTNPNNDSIFDLTAGVYQAAVIDLNGCSDTIDVTIDQPLAWSHVKDSTQATCYTYCDAQITITPGGGTSPYTHTWNTGSTGATIINLCAGVYFDTITDARGCQDILETYVFEPDSLEARPTQFTNIACFGDSTASVRGRGWGGTAPYTFEWGDPVFSLQDTILNAVADTYRVVITDKFGCTDTNNFIISEPDELVGIITDTVHANCVCNASAIVTPNGGTGPYTYLWNDINFTTDSLADSLCTGAYFVELTDANGCIDTADVTIRDTSLFTISITDTIHATCNGLCNGAAIATPNLGTLPFTYLWSDTGATTDSTVNNLCPGLVNVTVTDGEGCIRFASVSIEEPDSLIGTPQFTSPFCNGDTNGVAWVDITGGTGPYIHSWDTTSVNDTVYNIGIGFYTDTITDARGCLDTITVNVTEPAILLANLDSANISCFGSADGTVLSQPSGGTAPYSYEWNDPLTTLLDTVNNLDVGVYTAIITDFNGCSDTDSVAITQPLLLSSSITDTTHVACFCTGVATVTPIGGTAPYTYLWNDPSAQTDSSAIGLCAGSYEVAISDANGCTDTAYVTIRDTSGFVTDIIDSIMNGCYGICNGSALARAENGVQPYDFIWDNPTATNDSLVNNLCAGTYTVTISDAIGCTHIESVIITSPDSLEIAFLDTNVRCNGACDGAVEVVLTGGTSPYDILWSDLSATTDTNYIDSLCPGPIAVEIIDNNGCFQTDTTIITEPAELTAFINPFNHVSCFGENDASLTAMPTGGTAPYTYSWDSGENVQTISGKGPNSYTVTITDSLNCTDDTSLTVIEPVLLTSSITDTIHILCGGTFSGSATITPIGGTLPYSFDWFDAPGSQTDSVAINLPAGTYKVEVMDANGCSDTSEVTITEPPVFSISITNLTASSCIVCDGTASVTPTGGVAPYTYNWFDAPGTPTDSTATGLCASTYNVEVVDANGCSDTVQVTITGPGGLTGEIVDSSFVSCNTLCDGWAVASGIGGTSPYTYSWDNPALSTSDSISDLCAGTYTATIQDISGCLAYATIVITEPDVLVASLVDTNSTGCASPCNGDAEVGAIGGTAPYSYSWNDIALQTDSFAVGLCAGQYTATITDINGCTDTTVAVVTGPSGLTFTIDSIEDVTCFGACNGSIAVSSQGGVGAHTYSWSDPSLANDTILNDVCAGNYIGQVTDANGCIAVVNITIDEPTDLVATISNTTNTSCTVCDGEAYVTPTGGTAPYTYNWYDVPGTPTDSFATGLCAAIYHVEVIDANGCSDTAQVVITGPGGLTAGIVDTSMVSCNGLTDGLAVAIGIGGTGPYSYTWNDFPVTNNDSIENIGIGTYSAVVVDANGCNATAFVTITEPTSLIASILDTTSTGCASPCTGNATATVTGGTAPYSYSWNDWSSQSSAIATNLCAAQYTVTVTDANGCEDTSVAFVAGPDGLTVAIDSSVNISCNGLCDGNAAISATGGIGSYTYLWNDPSTTSDSIVTGLCAGNYNAQVTDGNGCLAFANISVIEPDPIVVSISDSSDITCNGIANGWALVAFSGGTAPFDISWNDAGLQSTDTATGLTAGTYTVTVTDAMGCFNTATVTIEQPTAITASTSNLQHVLCTGFCIGEATLTVSGGTVGGGYTYLWQDGQTSPAATGLCQGFQTYTITDGVGCTLIDSVEILDQNNFTSTITGTPASCNGDCDGTIDITPTGGTAPYVHSWAHGASSDGLTGLCPAVYIDTVYDNNGCFLIDSFEVAEPAVFTVSIIDSTDLSCFGLCDGIAVANGNGGTGPYEYTWYNAPGAQVNDTAYNLCAATYFVSGEDNNGCTAEDTITLSQPSQIIVSLDASTNTNCNGSCDGSATVSAIGGSGSLTYSWEDLNTLTTRTDLCADEYTVYATDDSSCVDSVVFTITQPDSLKAIITDTSHIICASVCNGDATVGETGGTGPFTYDWYDAGNLTSTQITGQCAGTYNVEVTDSKGCKDTTIAIINDINVLDGALATTHISCTGECDGKLVAEPIGGVAPYTYLWNDASTLDSIENLCQNNYFVTITDFDGCQVSVAGSIIEPAVLTSSIVDSANLDCFGVCDGYATVSPSGGTGPYTYLWDDIAAQSGVTASGLCAQDYKVVITDARGCMDSTMAYIQQPSEMTSSIVESQANCTNLADGSIDITVSGGSGSYSFTWNGSNSYTSGDEDPTGLAIGQYEVTILDGNGCSIMDTAMITEINVVNANAGNDTTVCEADSILLDGSGGVLYSWSDGGTEEDNLVAPETTTEYILTVFNNGCSDTDSVVVNINPLPVVTAIANDYLILDGSSTQLVATGAGTAGVYDWNPPIGLDDPTIQNPMAGVLDGTTYIVTGTDQNGCSDTAMIRIDVATTIVFPDGITPNGDGLNETWVIQLIQEFPDAMVQIYNRWGQKVFESAGYVDEWDGTRNGKKLPVGTYYYLIDLGPDQEKFTGPITLMR